MTKKKGIIQGGIFQPTTTKLEKRRPPKPVTIKLFSTPSVTWGSACGRTYLAINDYVVAMEGDIVRDPLLEERNRMLLQKDLPSLTGEEIRHFGGMWSALLIKFVVTVANGGVLP